jgi:hypothetical protein
MESIGQIQFIMTGAIFRAQCLTENIFTEARFREELRPNVRAAAAVALLRHLER